MPPIKVNIMEYVAPKPEIGFKLLRNVESGLNKIKILENLVKTLIRAELIKLGAYDRWNPYINHYQANFMGLIVILDLFHSDPDLTTRLKRFYRMYKKLSAGENKFDAKNYIAENYNLRQVLTERIKIASLPITEGFRTIALK